MTRRDWLALAAAAPLPAANTPGIDRFFDEFLTRWMRADPENATALRFFSGAEQDRLDAQLNDSSDEGAMARIALAKDGLAGLRNFDRAKLTPAQRLSADIFEYQLSDIAAEEPYLQFNLPLNQFRGVQVRLPSLMTDLHPVRNRKDAETYLIRLRAAGPQVDKALAIMRQRARQGIRLPGFISIETIGQMKRFTTPEPEQNILVTSFAQRLQKAGLDTSLAGTAAKIVRESVYPAYRRAMDGLATTNAGATDDAGIARLPGGAEAYAFYLRRSTTTNLTADQIHATGLNEVKRIEGEMDGLFRKLGYTSGSIVERWRKLEDDNLYPAGPDVRERILADYEKIIRDNNQRSAVAFDRTPKAACIVQRIPEFEEANAAANYQAPPTDRSRPGIFRVPLRGPKFTRAGMKTLAAHEAIPGHHFQSALQVEMTSLPGFRRQSAFGTLSAFAEGWGLYAERLASELGWYKDDVMSDIGRLNGELFRAKRLVVDTGLHTRRWTRKQAVDYGIAQSEVDRYTVWPGQACSYMIGQMKILEVRDGAKKAMGERFSLKAFHDLVLGNGRVPLTVLESTVREWQAGKAG